MLAGLRFEHLFSPWRVCTYSAWPPEIQYSVNTGQARDENVTSRIVDATAPSLDLMLSRLYSKCARYWGIQRLKRCLTSTTHARASQPGRRSRVLGKPLPIGQGVR